MTHKRMQYPAKAVLPARRMIVFAVSSALASRRFFPDEIYAAPESWARRAYPKLIRYGKLDKGGHFAAWEQPQLFVAELRAGFRSLR